MSITSGSLYHGRGKNSPQSCRSWGGTLRAAANRRNDRRLEITCGQGSKLGL